MVFHFEGILNDKCNHFIVGDSFFLRKPEYSSVDDLDAKVIKNMVNKQLINLNFRANWKTLDNKS